MADEILAGRLTIDTSEFTRKINEAVTKANAQIAKVGKDAVSGNDATRAFKEQEVAVNKLVTSLQRQVQVSRQAFQKSQVDDVTKAYKRLTNGVGEYNRAARANDAEGRQYWSNQIASAKQYLDGIKANVNELGVEENQRRKIIDTITKSDTAYKRFVQTQSQSTQITNNLARQWDKMYGILKLIGGISIYKIFGDAMSYAKDFDVAMTDISIITGKTRSETESLAQTYRNLANELGATSTQIAKTNAAVYRQGFTSNAETQAVTRGATRFGMITGQTVNAALTQMTPIIQNFRRQGEDIGQFVEHLSDVWAHMGDTVATTGEQIAEAMSKTSASVRSVGVSMEQASSWAAIMLAKTQQAGNVIGTQLNSLIARYSKITSKGYASVTSDDEGDALSFNDVSKALREVGIEMYDSMSKTFLPMSEVMDQLGAKWNTLDEAQQKYIATTLGGTRGMNYLLTLLQNYDQSLELMKTNVDGVTDTKYEAWLRGVEAAQNNLTNSMENLYAFFSNNLLTGFYNGMANVVDIFVAATDAVGGFNITLPLVATGVITVVSALAKLVTTIRAIKAAAAGGNLIDGLAGLLSGGKLTLILAGVAALATAIGAIISVVKNTNNVDLAKINEQIVSNNGRLSDLKNIGDELDSLSQKTSLTADEMARFIELREQFVSGSPYLQARFGEEGERISSVNQLLAEQNREYEKLLATQAALSKTYFSERDKAYKDVLKRETSDADFLEYSGGANLDAAAYYIGTVNATADWGGADGLSYSSAKALRAGLIRLAQDVDLTGSELEAAYNETFDKIEAAIVLGENRLRDAASELDLKGLFSVEDQLKMLDDNTNFMSDLIAAYFSTDELFTSEGYENAKKSIQQIGSAYLEILSGNMSEDVMGAFINGVNSDYQNSQVIDLVSSIYGNWLQAITNAKSSVLGPYTDELTKKITSEWGPEVITAFNKAFAEIANNPDLSMGEYLMAMDSLAKQFLNATEDEMGQILDQYAQGPEVEAETVESADDFIKKLGEVTGAIDEVSTALEKLKGANEVSPFFRDIGEEDMLTEDEMLNLIKLYPELENAVLAYREAMNAAPNSVEAFEAETALLEKLENIQINEGLFDGMREIGQLISAMEMLEGGDYTFEDIESLLEAFSELRDLDPSEWFDALSAKLEETTGRIRENAEALGLAVDEYEDFAERVEDLVHPMSDVEKAEQKLRETGRLNIKELSTLLNKYPELASEINAYGKDVTRADKLLRALNKSMMDDAMDNWVNNLESALKSLDDVEVGTRDYANAMDNLASAFDFQGFGALDNLGFVAQNLDNIRAAADGSAEAFRALQEAAWLNIVGTSDCDFSNIEGGIALVGEDANRLGQTLAALGLFEIEEKSLTSTQQVISGIRTMFGMPVGITTSTQQLNGTYRVLKPTSQNPFTPSGGSARRSGSSGGGGGGSGKKGRSGGGGGGGSSSIKVSDATSELVEGMSKVQDSYSNQLKILDLKREFHEIRGEVQGLIGYTKIENDILEAQNVTLQENIDRLTSEIAKKQAVIDKNKATSKAYKQAAVDLTELNKAHKEYSEKLLENINRLEKIQKELEKFEEDARQATISVQDLIRETLEAQKDYERGILDGTVDLEDEILEIIRTRYEEEQRLTIETEEKKKEAIQSEIDKIDELIEARKKLLNKEKQSNEIAQLQEKISRISADPTRRKEMLELQAQLADKQKELAWDTYEEELKAQKDSLEEQKANIDDHIDKINEYYEDLFENPQKLIKEMKDVMAMADSEIIDWLKKNHDEWSSYTEAKQRQTVEDWHDMINTMRGVTETYRKEIEEIMSWTDDEIITWLKNNNVEFKNATKEQQDSFIYSWKQTLNDWRNAYKSVAAEVSGMSYVDMSVDTSGGGGGGGGGGYYGGGGGGFSFGSVSTPSTGKSSGSGYGSTSLFTAMDPAGIQAATTTSASKPKSYKGTAIYYWVNSTGKNSSTKKTATSTKSYSDAIKAAKNNALNSAKTDAANNWKTAFQNKKVNAINYAAAINAIAKGDKKYIWFGSAYKKGGLIDYTGPAWVDGSPNAPERVLTAEQNALFESLVKTLQAIKTVNVSGFRGGTDTSTGGASSSVSIEAINIYPQSLDEDADFDLIAERVGDSIMEGLQRTMAIGGIRI